MGTESQSGPDAKAAIDGKFGDDKKGGTTQPCPTWISIHFVPLPPNHVPNNKPPGAGEQTFKDKYKFKLTGSDGAVLNEGVLDLRIGQIIRHDKAACGACTLTIDFPKFSEDQSQNAGVFWRRDWPGKATTTKLEFTGLETGKNHVFDIINELWAAAVFMTGELNTNAASADAKGIKAHMDKAADYEKQYTDGVAEAKKSPWTMGFVLQGLQGLPNLALAETTAGLGRFGWLVREGGPWDHKPKFKTQKMGETIPGTWHTWGEWEYYFDVWSNIHFGYVGRAAGISRDTLLSGASAEQGVQDLVRLKWPSGDAPQDRAAIIVGCDLFDNHTAITPEVLVKAVEDTHELDRRPHSYNSATAGANKSIRKR